METSIYSFIHTSSGIITLSLFGYTTKGLPGLEINGLKRKGKLIKEKMIYLTRKCRLKLPLLRYSLSLDNQDQSANLSSKQIKSLELPFLFMFWHLAGILPICKLDDCLLAGSFTTSGELYFLDYQGDLGDHYLLIGLGEQIEASLLLKDLDQLTLQSGGTRGSGNFRLKEYPKAL